MIVLLAERSEDLFYIKRLARRGYHLSVYNTRPDAMTDFHEI